MKERQEAEGRWRNVVAVKHAKNTDGDGSRTEEREREGEWRRVAQRRRYRRFLNYLAVARLLCVGPISTIRIKIAKKRTSPSTIEEH